MIRKNCLNTLIIILLVTINKTPGNHYFLSIIFGVSVRDECNTVTPTPSPTLQDIEVSWGGQWLKRVHNFAKLSSNLVWFDVPFHEEQEYSLGCNFRPCFRGENSQKPIVKILKKVVVLVQLF